MHFDLSLYHFANKLGSNYTGGEWRYFYVNDSLEIREPIQFSCYELSADLDFKLSLSSRDFGLLTYLFCLESLESNTRFAKLTCFRRTLSSLASQNELLCFVQRYIGDAKEAIYRNSF